MKIQNTFLNLNTEFTDKHRENTNCFLTTEIKL
jgi:hypothetical protein